MGHFWICSCSYLLYYKLIPFVVEWASFVVHRGYVAILCVT